MLIALSKAIIKLQQEAEAKQREEKRLQNKLRRGQSKREKDDRAIFELEIRRSSRVTPFLKEIELIDENCAKIAELVANNEEKMKKVRRKYTRKVVPISGADADSVEGKVAPIDVEGNSESLPVKVDGSSRNVELIDVESETNNADFTDINTSVELKAIDNNSPNEIRKSKDDGYEKSDNSAIPICDKMNADDCGASKENRCEFELEDENEDLEPKLLSDIAQSMVGTGREEFDGRHVRSGSRHKQWLGCGEDYGWGHQLQTL